MFIPDYTWWVRFPHTFHAIVDGLVIGVSSRFRLVTRLYQQDGVRLYKQTKLDDYKTRWEVIRHSIEDAQPLARLHRHCNGTDKLAPGKESFRLCGPQAVKGCAPQPKITILSNIMNWIIGTIVSTSVFEIRWTWMVKNLRGTAAIGHETQSKLKIWKQYSRWIRKTVRRRNEN